LKNICYGNFYNCSDTNLHFSITRIYKLCVNTSVYFLVPGALLLAIAGQDISYEIINLYQVTVTISCMAILNVG